MKRIKGVSKVWLIAAGILSVTLGGLVGCSDDDDDKTGFPVVVTNTVVVGNKTNVVVTTNAPPAPPPAAPVVLHVAGKWNGVMIDGQGSRHLDLTLTQNGAIIGGTFKFETGLAGSASGTITGDRLVVKLLANTALSPDFYKLLDGHVNASASVYEGTSTTMPGGGKETFALQK